MSCIKLHCYWEKVSNGGGGPPLTKPIPNGAALSAARNSKFRRNELDSGTNRMNFKGALKVAWVNYFIK